MALKGFVCRLFYGLLRKSLTLTKDAGIFVSRLDMGCAAEAVGLVVGDEIVSVNGVDVTQRDVECMVCKSLQALPHTSSRKYAHEGCRDCRVSSEKGSDRTVFMT